MGELCGKKASEEIRIINEIKENNKYPDCFPADIEQRIIEDGAGKNKYTFYRISRTGLINRDAFMGTIEERLRNASLQQNRDLTVTSADEVNIGDFSTSGYEKKKRCPKKTEVNEKI